MNKQNPQVVEACHQCLLWIIPLLDKFPRYRRFTLGEKMENHLLQVLALTTQAHYAQKQKYSLLVSANQATAVTRHLWRLSYELKIIDKRRYQFGSQMLVAIGKQIGAWQRVCNS